MKFSCSRCNTRYQIADERVRGKILKIRCKKCQTVISVRENMGSAPSRGPTGSTLPGPGGGLPSVTKKPTEKTPFKAPSKNGSSRSSALASAFEQAMTSSDPATAPDDDAPMSLEGEWYVAERGVQSGPFNTHKAKEWVGQRPPGAELFCWTDGFDDWKSVDSVAQFRDARKFGAAKTTAEPGGLLTGNELPTSESPGPLFADLGAATSGPAGPEPELEIGDVSRVVRLPLVAPPARNKGAALPGIAGGGRIGYGSGTSPAMRPGLRQTGGVGALSGTGGLPAIPKKHTRSFWILLILGASAVVGLVVLLFVMAGTDDDTGTLEQSNVAGGNLGINVGQSGKRKPAKKPETSTEGSKKGNLKTSNGGGKRVATRPNTRPNRTPSGTGEVDLTQGEDGPVELTPDDVSAKYRSNQFSINRCYERALKKDPFLDVKRATVTVSVDLRGRASAKIPGLKNALLRSCLEKTVSRWRFEKPKEALRTQLTMVFKSR